MWRAEGGALASGPNTASSYGHNQASASVFIARYYDNGATDPDLLTLVTSSNAVGAPPANPSQGFSYTNTPVLRRQRGLSGLAASQRRVLGG